MFERTALTFWNLINNSNYLIRFSLRKFETQNDQDLSTWAEIMNRQWTELIDELWPDFAIEFSTLVSQLVQIGLSPVVFKDENSLQMGICRLFSFYMSNKKRSVPYLSGITSVSIRPLLCSTCGKFTTCWSNLQKKLGRSSLGI